MRLLLSILSAWVLVTVVMVVWAIWVHAEERKQRERLRQKVNGGAADMPPWVQLLEKRKRRCNPRH